MTHYNHLSSSCVDHQSQLECRRTHQPADLLGKFIHFDVCRQGSISASCVIATVAKAHLINLVLLQCDRRSKGDHPLKQTLSHTQILQSFVILLQFVLWLLTMTIPQEGWGHTHTHTHRYLHCDDKLVNSLWLIGIALSCNSPANHLSWVRYQQSPF